MAPGAAEKASPPIRVTILHASPCGRRRGQAGAERRCLFSPPNRLPPQNENETALKGGQFRFVFRSPEKPVFPFHLHRSRGPGKQQALLPQPNKELPFVRACSQNLPCHEVGGDYFDYFDLDEGRFCFTIGDVAGKGISAALLASVVQGIFSTQTFLDSPLTTIVSNLNRNLTKRGTGNRFVTSFFGILDKEGNCTYVNAGHNPPLLIHPDGTMRQLTEGGMVLGLFSGAQYQSETVKLQPDDHLVLFTDGVVEALNAAGEEFGQDRVCALLQANAGKPAPEMLACLREAVLSFSARAPQHDDITIMVLGFLEAVSR